MRFNIEQYVLGDRRLKGLVRVLWDVFRGDPHWTPPLAGELLGSKLLGLTGLLVPEHPYHRDADVTHFVARDGRQLLGRVSAAVNYRFNEHYGSKIEFFGFFDVCTDYEVAEALLNRARDWIRDRGMTVMRAMFFGVCPRFRKLRIDAILYQQVQEYAVRHGYKICEASMLLEEDDLILRASASMDGARYKTWRVYEVAL